MREKHTLFFRRIALIALLSAAFYIPANTLAQSGKKGPGGGGKPGEETTMNLSYPAHFFVNPQQSGSDGFFSLKGIMSFGCLKPETIGTTTYPNTSCVDDTGVAMGEEECKTSKCQDYEVERIYWQKTSANQWQGGYKTNQTDDGPLPVNFVDWGDNLEGRTWPVQVLRVETNTFSAIELEATEENTRFDMWHVFGQGTNELWGVHATNEDDPVPYVYDRFPYAVNHTMSAMLNIAKLEKGSSGCPATATGYSQSPFINLVWTDTSGDKDYHWGTEGQTFTLRNSINAAELNIKGSYVYGYNWNLRSDVVPADWGKSGWWRLTFYTADNSIDFSTWVLPTEGLNTLAPPPSETDPAPLSALAAAESEGESGLLLYVPVIDKDNNLTYLDICIQEQKGGKKQ